MRRLLAPSAALALAACAGARTASPSPPHETAPRPAAPALAAGAEGGFETGKLSSPDQAVRGPFVLTYLAPGAELELAPAAGGGALGRVAGPLAQPLHVAAGTLLRPVGAGEALYAGYRPMPITRALDAWLGRQVLVAAGPGAQPEPWFLREIGGDHVTLERSRTYRMVPVRRIVEITWTDLTGIDPTPRIVLAPQ